LPDQDTEVIDGAQLLVALDRALRVFGDAGRRYIMDDLANRGIKFDADSRYTLAQVQSALSVMGEDGATLVMERVRKEIDSY
jgi:hypothetical protein